MHLFLFYLLFRIAFVLSSETHLTITIDPGDEECFYAPAEVGDELLIRYHVLQKDYKLGARINFHFATASGKVLYSDQASKLKSRTFAVKRAGDFKACFENSNAYREKQVYFTISVENDQNGTNWNDQDIAFEAKDSEDVYDVKLADIEHAVHMIRLRLHQAWLQQQEIRTLEVRDRSLAETNFEMVNTWSVLQMTLMVAVLAVQVVLVRNFFCDPVRAWRHLWPWR